MALSFNTGLKNVSIDYSKALKLNIPTNRISKEIEEHPFYPSLLSLGDTFEKFNCEGSGYNVSNDSVLSVPCPFIAYMNIPRVGKDFVLVHEVNIENVTFSYNTNKRIKQSTKTFLENYQGVIYIVDSCTELLDGKNVAFLKKNRNERLRQFVWYTLAFIVIIALVLLGKPFQFAFNFSAFLIAKLFGLAIAVALVTYESNQQNSFVKNICSFGKKTNCQAVLESSGSTVFGVTWAELGLIFFSSSFLFLLFPFSSLSTRLYLLSVFAILNSTYILFSLYYQWRVLKQWCPLCLAIQFILFSELLIGVNVFYSVSSFPDLQWGGVAYSGVIALFIPVLVWLKMKKALKTHLERDLYYFSFRRSQKNPFVFQALLKQQERLYSGWEDLGIEIGNPDAENIFVKVCNPFCVPCAQAHTILEDIITRFDNYKLKIIFNCSDKMSSSIAKRFIELSLNDRLELKQTLDEWYTSSLDGNHSRPAIFVKDSYPDHINDQLERMNFWCEDANVTYTPTIFLNGYKIPANFKIGDLVDIVRHLESSS